MPFFLLALAGLFSVPFSVQAGILDSIFGTEASAENIEALSSPIPKDNLQTLPLLEANTTYTSPTKDNKDSSKDTKGDVETGYFSDISSISENALIPLANALSMFEDEDSISADQISVYVVRKGDSLSAIAKMFEVSINTIVWANDLRGKKIQAGDVLLILPIDGVKHIVKKGETAKSLASKYEVGAEDIADFNNIEIDQKLTVGEEIIIPGGEAYVGAPSTEVKKLVKKPSAPEKPFKKFTSNFIHPVPGSIKTQGFHGKNAVDLAAPIGTPIYAAASGIIEFARIGWNGAYGNMVIIKHLNGTKTLYAHMNKISVKSGQEVTQGDLIGSVGNTGRVRASPGGNGAHLHFEVHGTKNPF